MKVVSQAVKVSLPKGRVDRSGVTGAWWVNRREGSATVAPNSSPSRRFVSEVRSEGTIPRKPDSVGLDQITDPFGIEPGATTRTSIPRRRASRANPNPVGPASYTTTGASRLQERHHLIRARPQSAHTDLARPRSEHRHMRLTRVHVQTDKTHSLHSHDRLLS